MISFRLDARSGVPTYLQLVQQVKQAVRLGILRPGDQLPTVKEVVAALAINPNTVLKAYRELDHDGLAEGRRGQGTFVSDSLTQLAPDDVDALRASLDAWVAQRARRGPRRGRHDGALLGHSAIRRHLEGRVSAALALSCEALGKRYGSQLGPARLHAGDPSRHGHRRSSARTAPARPPCCSSRSV